MEFKSFAEITPSGRTLQNNANFSRSFWGIDPSDRHTKISGDIPIERSSLTLCWVGFVFNSPLAFTNGSKVKCMKIHSPLCLSCENCLIASKNGKPSMSPTVPPISQSIKSTSSSPILMNSFISSVTCGITCIVFPK